MPTYLTELWELNNIMLAKYIAYGKNLNFIITIIIRPWLSNERFTYNNAVNQWFSGQEEWSCPQHKGH